MPSKSVAETLVGVDLGEKRIGIALGVAGVAVPVMVIERKDSGRSESDRVNAEIVGYLRQVEATTVVVGRPIGLDGALSESTRLMQKRLNTLKALIQSEEMVVVAIDERLSSVEASGRLHEAGMSSKRQRARLDASAAAVILQAYIDAR